MSRFFNSEKVKIQYKNILEADKSFKSLQKLVHVELKKAKIKKLEQEMEESTDQASKLLEILRLEDEIKLLTN